MVTKDHKKLQKTDFNITLSIEQQNAIDLLVTGLSDQKVAETVGVARETVTRWRLDNIAFQAELNRKRIEMWANYKDKMRSLLKSALDAIGETLSDKENSKRWQCAFELIKATGLHIESTRDINYSVGPTSVESIIRGIAWNRKETELFPITDLQGPTESEIRETFEELKKSITNV